MKNMIAVFLVFIMTAGLAGCGTPAPSEASVKEPAVSDVTSAPDAPASLPAQEPPPVSSKSRDSVEASDVSEVTSSAPPTPADASTEEK